MLIFMNAKLQLFALIIADIGFLLLERFLNTLNY